MPKFEVVSPYAPAGDQPQAIEALSRGVELGLDEQSLLGVTGSGKTFTMAKVIERVQKPTLVLAHNKTLAAQLCAEFKQYFPNNAVEYFVSYYDYYQPEAYIPHTDTFIEKDSSTNDEIDRLRLAATASLLERRDVIVVASVSCIYGLGEPEDFAAMMVSLRVGMEMEMKELMQRLIAIRYERNDIAFERNMFRVRGDTVDIWPAYWSDTAIRVEFFGDEIDRISEINSVTGKVVRRLNAIPIWPATHYVTPRDKLERAVEEIKKELAEQVALFEAEGKAVEAQRIRQRTEYDIEMIQELGYCSGIENYSRVIEGRPVGSIGPTTSVRMDAMTPTLLEKGLRGMIGKGGRGAAVVEAMKAHGAVYFAAVGGAAALMASCVTELEVICWDDLGPESIKRLTLNELPLIVAIDAYGNDAFALGQVEYLASANR